VQVPDTPAAGTGGAGEHYLSDVLISNTFWTMSNNIMPFQDEEKNIPQSCRYPLWSKARCPLLRPPPVLNAHDATDRQILTRHTKPYTFYQVVITRPPLVWLLSVTTPPVDWLW